MWYIRSTQMPLSIESVAAAPIPPGRVRDRFELRPPLKWAGGKRWQLLALVSLWAKVNAVRLVEPFCGGLSVTLGLRPRRALLNDINPHVINFYQWLKRGLTIDFALENDQKRYYQYRNRFNQLLREGRSGTSEAAGLFYYLNRTGYNGLCRFNSSGGFNVPFGKYRAISYRTHFSEYESILSQWEFTNADFERIELAADDFIYADPPYDVDFTQYSKGGFDWAEQQRVAEWLSRHPGPVVLSNQATPRILKLYRSLNFRLSFLEGPRRISCTGDRTPAREVLALRNLA